MVVGDELGHELAPVRTMVVSEYNDVFERYWRTVPQQLEKTNDLLLCRSAHHLILELKFIFVLIVHGCSDCSYNSSVRSSPGLIRQSCAPVREGLPLDAAPQAEACLVHVVDVLESREAQGLDNERTLL